NRGVIEMVIKFVYSLSLTICMLMPVVGVAQADAVKKVLSFEADGVQVILAPADNQLVSVSLGFAGGIVDGTVTNPAIPEFTSDLITDGGSTKYAQDAFRRFRSRTSTSIQGGGDGFGMNYTMTSTLPNLDAAWDVLSSIVLGPLFDTTAFRN